MPVRGAAVRSSTNLLRHLTADQARQYRQERWFTVFGGITYGRYTIHSPGLTRGAPTFNIDLPSTDPGWSGHLLLRCCIVIGETDLPLADHLLAQKLTIEADEAALLHANGICTKSWFKILLERHERHGCGLCRSTGRTDGRWTIFDSRTATREEMLGLPTLVLPRL